MSYSSKKRLSAFASLAILFIVGLFLAFKPAKAVTGEKVKRSTVYYYNDASTDFADMKAAGNWGTSQNPEYSCGGIDNVACSITVPDGKTLQQHLDSFSSLSSLIAVTGKRQ